MSNVAEPPHPGRASGRIDSVDLFRGLTIVAMIWVNDLARVRGVPDWLKHAPETKDTMTFPDVVFPAFLFIVGVSIPIALQRREAHGESSLRTLLHILGRTAGLLMIGVLMVNISSIDAAATGLSRSAWAVLMYFGVILAWNAHPKRPASGKVALDASASPGGTSGWRVRFADVLFILSRLAGAALLIWLMAIYRGTVDGEPVWLRTQWWGILGLIGWAYCVSSLCFLLMRGHPAGLAGVMALGMVLCIAEKNGALGQFSLARTINAYVSLGGHIGGHSAIVLSGVLAMLLVRGTERRRAAILRLAIMGGLLALAGMLLRHPYGISKVLVTPTWCLYCAALCCGAYAALYGLVDVGGYRRWSGPVRVVGTNALLAFILPGIIYGLLDLLGIDILSRHFSAGGLGIARSFAFTAAMIGLTAVLTRAHVRLRL